MSKNKFEKKTFLELVENLPEVEFKEVLTSTNSIIFDTNFLFVSFEFPIDIISEIKRVVAADFNLFIYRGTINELANIERKGDKNKRYLPLIAKMLKVYNFRIINSQKEYIDEQILENVNKKVLIATNDKELRQSLWNIPCKVLYMRQKRYFEIK